MSQSSETLPMNQVVETIPMGQDNAPISAEERKSVEAMVAYVSYKNHIRPEMIEYLFTNQFGVREINALPRKAYEDAMRYLVELTNDPIMN